jgi:hypothetical protein
MATSWQTATAIYKPVFDQTLLTKSPALSIGASINPLYPSESDPPLSSRSPANA